MTGIRYDGNKEVFYLLPYKAQQFVLKAVFGLPERNWYNYTREIGLLYGADAEKYANDTWFAWRAGYVQPSKKTKERLIRLAPRHISKQDKFTLVEMIVTPYIQKPKKTSTNYEFVETRPFTEQKNEFFSLAKEFAKPVQPELPPLPSNSLKTLYWLYDNDSTAVRTVLGLTVAQQTNAVSQKLFNSILPSLNRLQAFFDDKEKYGHFSETISFPRGNLTLSFQRTPPSSSPDWFEYAFWAVIIFILIKLCGG